MAVTNGDFSVAAGAAVPITTQAYAGEVAKTANYQLLAADNGTIFTTTGAGGAVTFTLPAIAGGPYVFEFISLVAFAMAVASSEGTNIVTDGNASASSLTFSTASHIIGGHLRFKTNAALTKWYVESLGNPASTITVA